LSRGNIALVVAYIMLSAADLGLTFYATHYREVWEANPLVVPFIAGYGLFLYVPVRLSPLLGVYVMPRLKGYETRYTLLTLSLICSYAAWIVASNVYQLLIAS